MMKAAIVGFGTISAVHIDAINTNPGMDQLAKNILSNDALNKGSAISIRVPGKEQVTVVSAQDAKSTTITASPYGSRVGDKKWIAETAVIDGVTVNMVDGVHVEIANPGFDAVVVNYELAITAAALGITDEQLLAAMNIPYELVIASAHRAPNKVHEWAETAAERGENALIVICDELSDPHNLGAIIRTAEAAGAHGVIVPKRRSAPLSFAVAKTSAGAVEFMHVARVTNIPQTLDDLKKRGVWVYCADMDGDTFYNANLKGAVALVIGSEGKGVGRLVKEKCDVILSMPMKGKINSLNASVAAGILMYEISKQRDI